MRELGAEVPGESVPTLMGLWVGWGWGAEGGPVVGRRASHGSRGLEGGMHTQHDALQCCWRDAFFGCGQRARHSHPCVHPLARPPPRLPARLTTRAGRDLTLTNYLLLALALFQFPYAFYLGVRP